jgi:hypothetical protein
MVPIASRAHRAASSLLLQTSRALGRDYLDPAEVAAALHEAFAQALRSYLAQRTLFGGESEDSDAVIAEWFDLAPRELAVKGATVLRKLNYLAYASPYRPLDDGEADWDAEHVRDEFVAIGDEVAALLAAESLGNPLPPFRGEEDVCPAPGTVVRYALYDWSQWTQTTCVVVESRPPTVLLRFADRHYEEVDGTVALIQPVPGQRVDLEDPFEAKRTRFELLLFRDDVGLYDDPHLPASFGLGRAVTTCSCCGYPTRRLQYPAFLRLPNTASLGRCVLCGWAGEPESLDAWVDGRQVVPEALIQARSYARASSVAFAPDDDSELAAHHRAPRRLELTDRARALFDGLLTVATPSERAEIWAATQVIVRSLERRPEVSKTRGRGEQRVTLAVQQALAAL